MQNDFHAKSAIENKKYPDPLTSVFGRTLQGRVGPGKKGKKTKKKAKRGKMSKLSQVSLKDNVQKDGHSGQEKYHQSWR